LQVLKRHQVGFKGVQDFPICPQRRRLQFGLGAEVQRQRDVLAWVRLGHDAVESVSLRGDSSGRGNPVSKKEFLNRFVYLLSKEPMREIDFKEAVKKGERALGVYFDAYHKSWNATMKPEFAIDGVKVGEVPLRGRLDRIDFLDENYARVIDYKFKKPMSRNQITGETKNSDGNYYRQLTFYKLLVDEGTKRRMKEAVLDFLEPDARGKLKQEVFAPSDKEVAELKKEIERVSDEILNLKFLSQGCKDKECKYCNLAT
jgi:CRISPR/Cas system-associated exonuclease Cas4 (RecB family)